MLRALGKLSLGLVVTFALTAACGSEDSKKKSQNDEGGAGGQAGATEPALGGGKSEGGEPPVPSAGQGGQAPMVSGGAGGEPTSEPMGGAGGEPTQTACCQPLTCDDVDFECGYTDDDCGGYVVCSCPAGTQCGEGAKCEACTQSPTTCQGRCGDVLDNCNTPITCADECGEVNPGSLCYEGSCCVPKTSCVEGDCGVIADGCGGSVDCGDSCVNEQVCTSGGNCCTPYENVCDGKVCGSTWNGCEEVNCGAPCGGTTGCVGNTCFESVCKAQGVTCGTLFNEAAAGYEECGFCDDGETCTPEGQCLAICSLE